MYITVETKDGSRVLLKIPDNNCKSITQLLKEYGYPLSGPCSKIGSCDSCHIRVIAGFAKIPRPTHQELTMLETLVDWHVDSRLACQVFPNPGMNGIIIKLI